MTVIPLIRQVISGSTGLNENIGYSLRRLENEIIKYQSKTIAPCQILSLESLPNS